MFRRAGASEIHVVDEWHEGKSFGEVLAAMAPTRGGAIVLSGGAVPLLNSRDAFLLVGAAASDDRTVTSNNRYSSDVIAVARARVLRDLPPLPSDNALPRWLEERAGYHVTELGSRGRLGLDLDTPQDVALAALSPSAGAWLRKAARAAELEIPNWIRSATSPQTRTGSCSSSDAAARRLSGGWSGTSEPAFDSSPRSAACVHRARSRSGARRIGRRDCAAHAPRLGCCSTNAARAPSPRSFPLWATAPSSTRECCWHTGSGGKSPAGRRQTTALPAISCGRIRLTIAGSRP